MPPSNIFKTSSNHTNTSLTNSAREGKGKGQRRSRRSMQTQHELHCSPRALTQSRAEAMLEFECGKKKDVSREQMLHKLAITHGKQRGQCTGSPQHHAEWSWMKPRGEKCHNPSTPCLQRLIKHKVNPKYLVSLSTARKWIKTPGKICFFSKWGLPWGVRAAHKSHSFPLFGLQLLVNAEENPATP